MRRADAVAVIAALVAAASAPAHAAYCLMSGAPLREPGSDTVRHQIPVWLYAPSNDSFAGIPTVWAEHELKIALDQWVEQSGANIRLYYAGKTTDTSTWGRIVVRENKDDRCAGASGCVQANYQYNTRSWRTIVGATLWMNPDGLFGEGWGSMREFAAVLFHELGHTMGLDDLYECGGGAYDHGGVMGGGFALMHGGAAVGRMEQINLREIYGTKRHLYTYRETTDLATWAVPSQPDSNEVRAQVGLGTGASGLGKERWFLPKYPSSSQFLTTCTQPECTGGGLATFTGPSSSHDANYAGAIAVRNDSEWLVAWMQEPDATTHQQLVWYSITTDGGASYAHYPLLTSDFQMTEIPGVSAAWDPRSSAFILALRKPRNPDYQTSTVLAQIPASDVLHPRTHVIDNNAWRTPVVACRNATSMNCMLAYLDEGGMHVIRTQRFQTDVGATTPFTKYSAEWTWIIGHASPTLVATRDATKPFVLAFRQDKTIYVSVRNEENSGWSNAQPVVTFSTGALLTPSVVRLRGNPIIVNDPGSTTVARSALTPIPAPAGPDEFHLRYALSFY
jgi:hypothetical protein